MRLALVKQMPGRQFKCLDCEGDDPLKSPDVAKLFAGELKPIER
jgi:hypothetical protein